MNSIALKMLFGDTTKYIGIIIGITFASLLMNQQASIFVGLMSRTYSFIADTGLPDVWIMDPKVQFIDDVKPLQSTQLYRIRGVEGIEWAMPLYKGRIRARLDDGSFQNCQIIGLDDTTLIGGPPVMVEGKLEDLRMADAVIVDRVAAQTRLVKPNPIPGGPPLPLKIGDLLELNDRRAVVVGLCDVTRSFQSEPTIYTTYSRATTFAPRERRLLSFVIAKAKPGYPIDQLKQNVQRTTGLSAYTQQEFQWKTVVYFLKNTGIPINFGITVVLGFIVGTAIAGQTFFNFTQDNLKYFAALKAMGTSNFTLLRMILLQAFVVGVIGYGLGVGLAAWFGIATGGSAAAFRMLWQILALSGAAVTVICLISASISIVRVIFVDPAIVFKG